jgi:hypothetical protein
MPRQRKPNDLGRSLIALDMDTTLIAVVELSLSSWLVAGIVPGVERQPLKKLKTDERPNWRVVSGRCSLRPGNSQRSSGATSASCSVGRAFHHCRNRATTKPALPHHPETLLATADEVILEDAVSYAYAERHRLAGCNPSPSSSRQRSRAFSTSAPKASATARGRLQFGEASRTTCAISHTFLEKPNLMQSSWSLMIFSWGRLQAVNRDAL